MTRINKYVRIAGLLYVSEAIIGPIRNFYIPGKLLQGDAAANVTHIAAHDLLFRVGMVTDLLMGLLSLFVALILYEVFKEVDKRQARLMVILGGLMVAPLFFVNTLNDAAVLILANGSSSLSMFPKAQTEGLVAMFLGLHRHGVRVNEIFWGLWLFPFGVLMYKSGFLPKFLGVLAFINGFAYLIMSFTGLLLPSYGNTVTNLLFPAIFGEVVIMLWLLIMGAKERGSNTAEQRASVATQAQRNSGRAQ